MTREERIEAAELKVESNLKELVGRSFEDKFEILEEVECCFNYSGDFADEDDFDQNDFDVFFEEEEDIPFSSNRKFKVYDSFIDFWVEFNPETLEIADIY